MLPVTVKRSVSFDVKPGSSNVLKVGSRSYGPLVAAPSGKVAFDIDLDPRELACIRLQAHLTEQHGLRDMLGPTSDFRAYWDALPADPLAPLDAAALARQWQACGLAHSLQP